MKRPQRRDFSIYIISHLSLRLSKDGQALPLPSRFEYVFNDSLFPSRGAKHITNFPWWGPPHLGIKVRRAFPSSRCQSQEDFGPTLASWQLLFSSEQEPVTSSEPTTPPGPVSTPVPCQCSSRLVQASPGCHVPTGALTKEDTTLRFEPAFQQHSRTGLRNSMWQGQVGICSSVEKNISGVRTIGFPFFPVS